MTPIAQLIAWLTAILFAIPSMSPQGPGPNVHGVRATATAGRLGVPAAATPDPTDPNPGGCWTYAEDEVTVIDVDCASVGLDPQQTIEPMPAGWVECQGEGFDYWASDCSMTDGAGSTPEPTP